MAVEGCKDPDPMHTALKNLLKHILVADRLEWNLLVLQMLDADGHVESVTCRVLVEWFHDVPSAKG